MISTRDGWVAFKLEGSDRKPASTDAERAALMRSLVACIGRYRIEGDQRVTTVLTAGAPEWVGTEQRRSVRLEGDDAEVTTPWRVMPNWDDGRSSRSLIRFKRASEPDTRHPKVRGVGAGRRMSEVFTVLNSNPAPVKEPVHDLAP